MNTESVLLKTLNELDAVLKENRTVIYGAGVVAKTVIRYAAIKRCDICCIAVTDRENNPFEIMRKPVYALSDVGGEILKDKNVVLCVMENKHTNIKETLRKYQCETVYCVSDELFGRVAYEFGDFELELLARTERLNQDVAQIKKYLNFVPKPCLEFMVLNILDHCNLKCKGCDHFACIADPYFVPFETVYRDLQQLSKILHGDYIMQMGIMGGEPLLHPDLLKILKAAREFFPYCDLELYTNGLLLLNQDDEFWKVMRENRIGITQTKYPINLKFEKIEEKAKEEQVRHIYFDYTGNGGRRLFKKHIDLKGLSNPAESFANCILPNFGNFLMEGKMYSCPFSCQSYRIFNKKFNQNLRMTERDYVDIYQVNDMQELFDFAAKPKYYCRYCTGVSEPFSWERTKGSITEWV